MSHKLTATNPSAGRATKNRSIRPGVRAALAGALAIGLAMSGTLAATAEVGGGGVGGGGAGSAGGIASDYWLFTGDNYDGVNPPWQGWGQTSIDTFASAMEQQGGWADGANGRTAINTACGNAINEAIARSGGASTRARVIQVGVAVGYNNGSAYMGWGGDQAAMQSWYQSETNANTWQPNLGGYDGAALNRVYSTFMANIPMYPRVVCVAMNEQEPVSNYDLIIDTDKSATFSLAGQTAAVSDTVNTGTASPIRESIIAVTTLHWAGVEGNPASVAKQNWVPNVGNTPSPNFVPSDFGWTSWPAGQFWFDVNIPQQGRMKAATSHAGQNDPRESWSAGTTAPRKVLTSGTPADALAADEVLTSGMFYNAEVTARTNGFASSMTINDTVRTDQVFIGSATADDASKAYMEDPNGNPVAGATVTITRSAGTVKVSGTVTNIPAAFQAQEYTLVVPTYVLPTETDYTITDDSSVCYTAAQSNCIAGNSAQTRKITHAADKVWVLDENGALAIADPGKTNQVGADEKTFAPGSAIGAVVNGKIPAKLAEDLSSYSLTDDWSGAAKYIDFTDTSKAKVFLNGVNVTNQFDITISGSKTTATAKATFLGDTKGLAQSRSVKLFVGGTFKLDYETDGKLEKLTNTGSERWNNETVEANAPAIYTVTANPDKVWVIDENGALAGFDPDKTNNAGVDNKTFAPGAGISAVVNGSVPADLGAKLDSYTLTDDWTGAAKYLDFSDANKVKVFLDGTNVTSQFDIAITGTTTVATAKAAFLDNTVGRATAGTVKLFVTGEFRNTYDTNGALDRLTNAGSESWNGKVIATNTPAIYTITPTPDKVWVLDENGGLSTSDEDWSNTDGADGKIFLQNDAVAAVVNGSIPADLGSPLYNYSLVDDWTAASKYVDFSQVALAKVFYNGVDVTAGFDVNVVGTTTVATAKAPFLAATAGLAAEGKVKLIISGFFRDDYDTDGQIVQLTNSGSETWNNRTEPTNAPPVYVWTPNPSKQVLGSADESGNKGHDDINGASVWPGQKLEYSVGVDLRVPAGTARGVKTLAVEDVYDPYFTPDKSSIEFWDSRNPLNPRPVPRAAYKIVFDEAAHKFTTTFTKEWIDANVGPDGANDKWLTQGWLTMRFTGTVSKSVAGGSTVVNQAFQIINGGRTATEVPTVLIPTVVPKKDSLNTDMIDIDGKTVVEGDVILYRLLLDGGPSSSELAYNVHKFGIVDDYDQDFLGLEAADVTVSEKDSGLDVTGKFNVQVKDGVAYVFAKTIDTAGVYGGIIAGDPQAADLAAHDVADIRPLEDPIIDQALLGKNYWVTLRTTVTKEQDGYVIENQARQNIQNISYTTRIVSNPLKDIDPKKDVVISEETKDASVNEAEIRLWTPFNYRLDSSEIPANRAYKASQWSVTDTFDRVHDQYTGIWAIYSNTDVYEGATLIFKKGDLLADSASHESEPWKDLFAVAFDATSYTFTATATQKYLDLVETRPELANAFSVYTKIVRIAPAEKIENKVTESYNGFVRDSNIVWTFTNEYPAIAIEKFTLAEGNADGDRDDVRLAYEMTAEQLATGQADQGVPAAQNGVAVGIRFSNSGDVPLVNVQLADVTHDGMHGELEGMVCAVPAAPAGTAPAAILGTTALVPDENGMVWVRPSSITELPLTGAVDCRGTLRGMEPGMIHGDTVVVAGESVFTQKSVKAEDVWFAKAPSTPTIEVVEYTLEEGLDKGDRNEFANALVLAPEQAQAGVKVGFNVTNTGDEPLANIELDVVTNEGTTGKVADVLWLDPVAVDEDAPDLTPGLVPIAPVVATSKLAEAAVAAVSTTPVAVTPAEGTAADATIAEVAGQQYTVRPLSELTKLAVGESVLLVGTLTGVEAGTGHSNMATVTAEAVYSTTQTSDTDPWNAKLPIVEAPPIVPTIAVTGDPVAQAASKPGLLGGAALLLMAAGLVAYGIHRRSRFARSAA
jgi:adhesin isopeptide-forming family sspB-C2 type protein